MTVKKRSSELKKIQVALHKRAKAVMKSGAGVDIPWNKIQAAIKGYTNMGYSMLTIKDFENFCLRGFSDPEREVLKAKLLEAGSWITTDGAGRKKYFAIGKNFDYSKLEE
jgi:hypothetical protein